MIRQLAMFTVLASIAIGQASAQERVSLKPVFKADQESRYVIAGAVETTISPSGTNGIAYNLRREMNATVLIRTIKAGDNEVTLEAVVESVTSNSSAAGSGPVEAAGKKIELTISCTGQLLKCSIPNSFAYQTVADLLLSTIAWNPRAEVKIGDSWENNGSGPVHSDRLSAITRDAKTSYKLASLANGVASIEGAATLSENGTSPLNSGGVSDIAVIAGGKGISHVDFDTNAGRILGAVTDSHLEGKASYTRPSAAGEKLQSREGSLMETSKFSIKLIQ